MLQRLRVLAHAHNPHCARRIGQLRMQLMQQADGAVQVLGTMSSQFSLHSRLVHNVRVDMNHACKQLAIVNSSSFSTPAIPEESPQSRRWDADFHAFVCRVVAVRIIMTNDMLWYTADVYLLELYISLRWFWIVHAVSQLTTAWHYNTDLNLMQLSLICPQAMTLLQVGRRWGVIGDLNYLIPFSQSLSWSQDYTFKCAKIP